MPLRPLGIGLGVIPTAARPGATTAPVNVVKPFFDAILTQGQAANPQPGSWTGLPGPNFSYSIKRSGVEVSTDAGYVWTSADVAAGAGAMTLDVTATNSIDSTTATSDAVTIAPPLQVSGSPGPAFVGSAYNFSPEISGGHGPYEGQLDGVLLVGLEFDGDAVQIGGAPTSSGTASDLTITVTDADGLFVVLGPFSITASAGTEITPAYDSGAVAATTSIQTSALWGGVYSCLLTGGTGGTVWQYVAVTFGKANIKNWSDTTKTFTRAKLFGPHEDLSHPASLMGGAVSYACLPGQAETWEVGTDFADPMQTTVGLKNLTNSPSFICHQGFAYLPNGDYIGFDNAADGGMKVWDRTTNALKWQNTSEVQHHGAGKYWAGTMQNVAGGGSKTGIILVPCSNYTGGGSSSAQCLRCYSPETGLPVVKLVNLSLPVGETGTEPSSLSIKEATGEIFITSWYSPKVFRVLMADVVSAANGGTVNATLFASLTSEIRDLDGSLYHPESDTFWALGNIALAIEATTGKVAARLAYTNISGGGAGGSDIDPITGKVGISGPDGSGVPDSLCLNLYDPPVIRPANLQTGFPMRKTFGLRFPNAKLDQASYSVFGVAIPKSLGATVRATDQASQPRQSIIDNSASGNSLADFSLSRFRWQGPSNGSTWRVSPAEVIVVDQRWVFGATWSDASTTHEAISYTGNSDNAFTAANSAVGGPTTRDAWTAGGILGISARLTDGLADLDVGCFALITGVKLSATQIAALRDNPAQLFVVNDPLSSGQKATLEAA